MTHRHDIIWDRTGKVVNTYIARQKETIQEVIASLEISVSDAAAK